MDANLKRAVGNNVKELRTGLGLTQKEFAERVHTTRAVITAIEMYRGTSIDVLDQIARVFGVEIGELLSDKENAAQRAVMRGFDPDVNYDECFNELPLLMQSFGKAMTVQLSKYFGISSQVDLLKQTEATVIVRFLRLLGAAGKEGKTYEELMTDVAGGQF